jgi:hypothetical protein
MIVTNIRTGETFDCISFERQGDGSQFILAFPERARDRFEKDAKNHDQYYKIIHEYDDWDCTNPTREVRKIRQIQFFKVVDIWTCESATESFFWKKGDLMFVCDELDNFGKARMISDLRKQDPSKPWHKVLNEKQIES